MPSVNKLNAKYPCADYQSTDFNKMMSVIMLSVNMLHHIFIKIIFIFFKKLFESHNESKIDLT